MYKRGKGTTAKRLKQKRTKEQLDSIKDDDIKREVKMGGKVTIEEDSTESGDWGFRLHGLRLLLLVM